MDHTENEQKAKRKQNDIGRFLAVAVLTIVLAAGYFLLWAYLSYELRLSAEVIRAGLVLLYIIPCWIGGRVLRRCMHGRTLENGLIHRLASLNAYIGCSHPEVAHEGYFMICKECNNAYELAQHSAIDTAISSEAQQMGFTVETQMVEILGICAACREAA